MLSEPIPASLPATGEQILIVAALPDGDVLYVEHDGYLKRSDGDWIKTDWRYNAETKTWYDINGPKDEPEESGDPRSARQIMDEDKEVASE